jgi:hypothetical protein
MLFLVISTPRADPPGAMTARREKYWDWIAPLLDNKTVLSVHARVGRGAVALFDVDSNLTLHRLINEWAEIIPAHHDIYPLLDSDAARAYLKVHRARPE